MALLLKSSKINKIMHNNSKYHLQGRVEDRLVLKTSVTEHSWKLSFPLSSVDVIIESSQTHLQFGTLKQGKS